MSNNNATAAAEGRPYNGEHIKRTTAVTAASTSTATITTTTITTKLQVDEKLRAAISGNVVENVSGGGSEEGAAATSMSACDKALGVVIGGGGGGVGGANGADYDVNCEGAAASACATNIGIGCYVGGSVNDDDAAADDVASANAGAASWLAMQMYATNNNILMTTPMPTTLNNTVTDSIANLAELQQMSLTNWWVDENGIVHKYDEDEEDEAACQIADKGGGNDDRRYMTEEEERQFVELNGEYGPGFAAQHLPVDLDLEYAMAAAAIITPPEHNTHSNRTSLNNSTENLSYNSDYNYQDDIILLDDELDPEEVSLNSDDCIYAYRGDGDEMEFAVLNAKNVKANDDETDFLEMDFEPDPLSEVEYGEQCVTTGGLAENAVAASCCDKLRTTEPVKSHANALLLQRNSCHISSSSDRQQSAVNKDLAANTQPSRSNQTLGLQNHHQQQQRQHFSSPIDELPNQTANCLQTQAMLSKNFARISLHLDQINISDASDNLHIDKSKDLTSIDAVDMLHSSSVGTHSTAAARSLPSTLNAYAIEREAQVLDELNKAPAKITGAKPKRLSRFSSTSSTSSKTSTKSRNSLRASLTPAICSSVSFDERSVSCNDFRSTQPLNSEETSSAAIIHVSNPLTDIGNINDETCLDCLENEFLASTIGKVVDTNKCMKCHKRRQSSTFYNAPRLSSNEQRCRSGSPTYMLEYNYQREEALFDEFSASTCSQWLVPQVRHNSHHHNNHHNNNNIIGIRAANELYGDNVINAGQQQQQLSNMNKKKMNFCIERSLINQRRKQQRDSYKAEQQEALKNFVMTEPEIKICTLDITEDILVQALDKLHVPYNSELIKAHFAKATSSGKVFKNLKDFLLHASKKNCNHSKMKRLILLATRQQIEVIFKEDPSQAPQAAMISVKVTDIIQQWTRNKNLEILKQLDKRFLDANIMGKVANVIRQAQQQQQSRGTARRPLLEFIQIPQYYPSGHLILKNKK